ncbi:MAG: hypothetical protein Q8880_07925 [Bacteroidota bacterium]|nr:hypothetical protein [Bacteroidota bacterium]
MRQGIGYRGFINLIIQENLILSLILQTIKTNDSKTVDNNTPGATSIVSYQQIIIKFAKN